MKDTKSYNPGVLPCGHRLVVYPLPTETVTAGGIVIPAELARRESMAQVDALVVAIGPTCWHDQPQHAAWCKVGDTIKIAKFSGLVIEGKDERAYRVISDLDVVCVCTGESHE